MPMTSENGDASRRDNVATRRTTLTGLLPLTARRKPSLKRPGCLRGVYARCGRSLTLSKKSGKHALWESEWRNALLSGQRGIAEKSAAGFWG
jgi:hypothetical protein